MVLPNAALVTVFGLRKMTNIGEPAVSTIDWFSVAASAVGFGGMVYGLSLFGEREASLGTAFVVIIVVLCSASSGCSAPTRRCWTCAP